MRGLRLALIVLVAVWLEVSFFGAWRPFDVIPNVFLIVILVASLCIRASEALALAIGGGLLLDLASGVDFGLRTAFFCFLTLLVVVIRRTGADFDSLSMKLAAVLSSTVLYNTVVLVSLVAEHVSMNWRAVVARIAVEIAFNALLLVSFEGLLRRLLGVELVGASRSEPHG